MQLELHLIMNQRAGSGNGAKVAEIILQALKQKNIPFTAYPTTYPGHAIDLAHDLLHSTLKTWPATDPTSPFPLLVVLGGDGTLHEVLNALSADGDIPLGYIPAGSGNDFARGIGLSRQPLVALDHLLATTKPQTKTVIHYVEHQRGEEGCFTNNLGLGLDASIVWQTNESTNKKALNKIKLGALSYLSAAFSVLQKQKGFPLTVTTATETKTFAAAYLCTATNHPYFGGGIAIAPNADINKADLELVVIERYRLWKILHLITLVLRKKHLRSKAVHHFKTPHLHLKTASQQYVQVDGELLPRNTYDLSLTPTQRLFWV